MSFYITTPIYYVNSNLHLGHAYTTILADVIQRYHRLREEKVFFLTGVDEHGQKVFTAAQAEGIEPQQHCDQMAARFQELWEKLNVEHSRFIRTTEPAHRAVVQKFMQRLYDEGNIFRADYEGWYCVSDERFFTEKDLDDGNCPLCHREVIRLSEPNYFFDLGKYQQWLIDYIEANPDFILPATRRNEVLGFLRQPLEPLCISRARSRMSWGIPLPFDEDFVTYVWFDALLNYVTGIDYSSNEEQFARFWPADIHLIGKDILTTHAVYWPIMLQAGGLEQPRHIIAHGWWLTDDAKMAKSEGNVVDPLEMVDQVGIDPFRYFLIRGIVPWKDANFNREKLLQTLNNDLANDLGNLLSRLTNLVNKFYEGKLPQPQTVTPPFSPLLDKLLADFPAALDSGNIYRIVDDTLALVSATNRYLEETAPWKLVKTDNTAAGTVLYHGLEVVRLAAGMLSPIMPGKTAAILSRFQLKDSFRFDDFFRWGVLAAGTSITHGEPLFPRLELDAAPAAESPTPAPVPEPETEAKEEGVITIDEFQRMQLITGRILSAEPVPDADQLLKLQVDCGDNRRQLVAGIAGYYDPEQLRGLTILVVANLKPTVIRGIESQGMLLAAQKGKKLVLATVDGEIPPGVRVS